MRPTPTCTALVACLALAASDPDDVVITPLILEGDNVAGIGDVTTTGAVAVNDDGEWLVEIDTNNPDTDVDGALIDATGVFIREGAPLADPFGTFVDSFGAISGGWNNAGDLGCNWFLDGTPGGFNDDSGVFLSGQLVIQEATSPSIPGLTAGTTFEGFFSQHLNDDGQILCMASVDDPLIASSVDRALLLLDVDASGVLLTASVVRLEGDVPPGQTEAVADMETSVHNFALNDAGTAMYIVDLAGDTAVDHAVYINDTLVAQEGSPSPVPGRTWDLLSSAELDLNNSGSWVLSGSIEGDTATDDILVVDGELFIQTGDSLPAIGGSPITGLGTTGSSGPVYLGDNGNVLWSAEWNGGSSKGLFLNDRLLAEVGVTTIGGLVLEEIFAVSEGYAMSDDGQKIVFRGRLAGSIDGAFLIDVGPWVSLGKGLAGTGGVTPCLTGSGTLAAGDPVTLALRDGVPGGATNLVIGIGELCAPFKGGFLVPTLDTLIGGLPLDANGDLVLTAPLPAGLPSGFDIYFQHWAADAGGVAGFSASNAVRGTTP